jgi:hypothetical protein
MSAAQRVLVVLVFVAAMAAGVLLALTALKGGGSPGPTSVAGASTVPTAVPVETGPSPSAAAPTEASTSQPTAPPTPVVVPSATPKATTAPGPVATIVVTRLTLDAADDPAGQDRLVTFESGDAGTITVALATRSPTGSTRMCLTADGTALGCRTGSSGTLTATTTKRAASFGLTLRGIGVETPEVEVTITFPATTPSVTVANTRFDGTMFPGWNGLEAIVTPRTDGGVRVTADWGGHPFLWELDVLEQGGSGRQVLADQGPATRMDKTLPVTAANPWKVLLLNTETGFGTTPMTVTVAWP